MDIANGFCKYFTNIGPSLTGKIPASNHFFWSFLPSTVNESIILKPTSTQEVRDICNSFKSGKAPGCDNIAMTVIKDSLNIIADPLSKIINISLKNGIFPDKLKVAKVLPAFKSEDPQYFVNYRPITLLPNFSKIFEKVVYNRFIEFIERLEILYCCQFGFRKNHSTALSLINLINKIAESIDRNEVTIGVFLDLSKAFDTLDHEILLNKPEHYGIRDVALDWVKSYLSERLQFVQFNQTSSSKCQIHCGVPQGSILGPLFFILYINDLPFASSLTEPLLFADDTSILYSHRDQDHLISVLNEELIKIDSWMRSNKLSVNIKKTNYVVFKSAQKKASSDLPLSFNSQILKEKNAVKFLGAYIDNSLTWKSHINHVCKKMSKSIGVIFRSRFFLTEKTLLSLYYTLVYPYISYCSTVWTSTYPTNLNRIYLLQKRAVRAIT